MNRLVIKQLLCYFRLTTPIQKCQIFNECLRNNASKSASCNFYCQRSLHLTPSINKFVNKRRRKPEPIVLKVKSFKQILELYNNITLRELAIALNEDLDAVSEFILNLNESNLKVIDKPDDPLDQGIVLDVVAGYGFKPRIVTRPAQRDDETVEDVVPQPLPPPNELQRRAPVVTIMGHVDHGKTTLLDALRSSRIAAQEFGGITQHIGAFSVVLPNNKQRVTFLDTPGHSAFKAMRQRGARSTDIVVLVVAADDGVKEQTVESIRYAREAGVPIVVAINKCDKPTANPENTKHELMYHNVVVEELGGDVQVVEISALHGKNLDKLQEALITQAEIMDLKSTSEGRVEGVVIESSTIQGLGKVCTMIVNRGTLKYNTCLLAGVAWGRVKTMHDEFNRAVELAGPSCPVRISGWRDKLPSPGDIVFEVEDERRAQSVVEMRNKQRLNMEFEEDWKEIEKKRKLEREINEEIRKQRLVRGIRYDSGIRRILHKESAFAKHRVDENAPLKVSILLRCDVDGSLEAILNVLETYNSEMVHLDIVDFGVGPPNETNVSLAHEFNATIYCFNTSVPVAVREMSAQNEVEIKQFNVIYKLVDELKDQLSATLKPDIEEKIIGEGHVLKQFLLNEGTKKMAVAGCLIDCGVFDKTMKFRFLRKDNVFYEGGVETLKCGEEFVASIGKNNEVGIVLPDKTVRFKPDDHIEVFEEIIKPRRIDWNPQGF